MQTEAEAEVEQPPTPVGVAQLAIGIPSSSTAEAGDEPADASAVCVETLEPETAPPVPSSSTPTAAEGAVETASSTEAKEVAGPPTPNPEAPDCVSFEEAPAQHPQVGLRISAATEESDIQL